MSQELYLGLYVLRRDKMLANRGALFEFLLTSTHPLLRPQWYWGQRTGWLPFSPRRKRFVRDWTRNVFSITLGRRRSPCWELSFMGSSGLFVDMDFRYSLLRSLGKPDPLLQLLARLHELLAGVYGFMHNANDNRNIRGGKRAPPWFVDDPLQLGICGVRWVNLFGPEYVELIGEERLKTCPAARVERLGDGAYLVVTDERPPGKTESRDNPRYRAVRDHLGEDIFADGATNRPARLLPSVRKDKWPLEEEIEAEARRWRALKKTT